MPTVLIEGPYRFFFYSADREESRHIHVERDECSAKFWLEPIRLQKSRGFSRTELRQVQRLVDQNEYRFMDAWHEHFGD